MVIISNSDGDDDGTSDGGDDDGTSGGGGGGDTCGSDDGDDGGGDGIGLVARSVFARSLSCRASRSPNRRPSVGRPHSELVGAARHTTGRSKLQLRPAPAPLPPHRWPSVG